MTSSYLMKYSRSIPVDPETAFEVTLPIPLPTIFSRRFGPIAPIRGVEGQTGDWSTAGESRTVLQVGGDSIRETLTHVEPPTRFAYKVSEITGALALLIDRIDGEWRFEPNAAGTQVTWRWNVYPKSSLARPVLPVLAFCWRGYARRGMEALAAVLTTR